jgi:hypothetical protein
MINLFSWETILILICLSIAITLGMFIFIVLRVEQNDKDKLKRVIKFGIPLRLVIELLVLFVIF